MERYSVTSLSEKEAIRKEYASLKERSNKKYTFLGIAFLPLHIFLTVATTLITWFITYDRSTTLTALAFYGIFPGSLFSGGILLLLEELFGQRVEKYVEQRRLERPWYKRYQLLDERLKQIKAAEDAATVLAEQKRLAPTRRLVEEIEQRYRGNRKTLIEIEDQLRYKRKWYAEYRDLENDLAGLADISQKDLAELRNKREYVGNLPLNLELISKIDTLTRNIGFLRYRCFVLEGKLRRMKDWAPPDTKSKPVDKTRTDARATFRPESKDSEDSGKTKQRISPGHNDSAKGSDSSLVAPLFGEGSQITDFPEPELIRPPGMPLQNTRRIALPKVPLEEYIAASIAKRSIGELGEILVEHFERRRVELEIGRPADGIVKRVSEEADGLGYDIESVFEGKKVFIEVKTTTGTFWKDFYFTQNERERMEKLGENYWLYRVSSLSTEDGSAQLSMFKGRNEIEEFFVLEPYLYKFRENRKERQPSLFQRK